MHDEADALMTSCVRRWCPLRLECVQRVGTWLATFRPSLGAGLLLAFGVGWAVRLLPELLAYPYAIGFDTVYYAWRLQEGVVWAHWSQVFSSWLVYALLVPFAAGLRLDPFVVLKLAMPVLFGVTVAGVFYLAVQGLRWSTRKGLVAAGLFAFSLAALRISSDLYRNMLGLGVLLFAVPWMLRRPLDARHLGVFSVLALLTVVSHEYVAVLLLVSVAGVVLQHSVNHEQKEAAKVAMAAVPAAAVFLVGVVLRAYPLYKAAATPNILSAYQSSGQLGGPLFFLTNYLAVSSVFSASVTYVGLVATVVSLFLVLYGVLVPLVVVGGFRHRVLDVWTGLLLVGGVGCLVVPFSALQYWDRWMMLLVLPLTFYATHGFVRVLQSPQPLAVTVGQVGTVRVSRRTARGLVLASVTMGFVFITSPMFLGLGGVYALPTTVTYLPSTMLASTIPLTDVAGTVDAFEYLDGAMDANACLLAHHAFVYWARLYVDEQHVVVCFNDDVDHAIAVGAEHGLTRFFLVWWNTDIGWYGSAAPADFQPIFHSGRISVFEYVGQ
jgi:hypothetical protein